MPKSTDAKATEDERKLGLWKKRRKSSVKKEDVAVDVTSDGFCVEAPREDFEYASCIRPLKCIIFWKESQGCAAWSLAFWLSMSEIFDA
ncbi:MAG: hypothetical protein ABSF63_16025 [Candidatus Bathyarchaeia archaeon]|jgi:hypothetical protein